MRTISEMLRLNKQSHIKEYKYVPNNKSELMAAIKIELKKDKNANLNDIDISNITDMSYLFHGYDPFKIKIDEWDMHNVTKTKGMFKGCINLDCNLSDWDISNVLDAEDMFFECYEFKGTGLKKWKPLKLKNATSMFFGCQKFVEDLSQWETKSFKDTANMFVNCYLLDFNVKDWDMSNAINMGGMFYNCKKFQGLGLEEWKLSTKADINEIFDGCLNMIKMPRWAWQRWYYQFDK